MIGIYPDHIKSISTKLNYPLLLFFEYLRWVTANQGAKMAYALMKLTFDHMLIVVDLGFTPSITWLFINIHIKTKNRNLYIHDKGKNT